MKKGMLFIILIFFSLAANNLKSQCTECSFDSDCSGERSQCVYHGDPINRKCCVWK